MYVRIFWGRVKQGKWDEYERFYNENVGPVSQKMKGFLGRQLMRSTVDPDEGASISLWETMEDLARYERSPERQRLALAVEHLYAGQYWIGHFETPTWFGSDLKSMVARLRS